MVKIGENWLNLGGGLGSTLQVYASFAPFPTKIDLKLISMNFINFDKHFFIKFIKIGRVVAEI